MKKYEQSRGWRNCNPLNIRRGEQWQGLRAQQTDKAFCQFLTMSFGYRAAVKCMMSYYRFFCQRGMRWQIDSIIRRWAPENENDTEAYIRRVLELMGREPGQVGMAPPTTSIGRLQLAMMIAAMTCVETGCPSSAVPVALLNMGFSLANQGNPGLTSDWWKM